MYVRMYVFGVVEGEEEQHSMMSGVVLIISNSPVDCNGTTLRPQRSSSTVLYLTKTFMVETLYYCNLLDYVKGSTVKAVAMILYHNIIIA